MSKTGEDMDEVIGIDMKKCNPSKDLGYDRLEWRNKIHLVNTNIVRTRLR